MICTKRTYYPILLRQSLLLIALLFVACGSIFSQTVETFTIPGTNTWTCPAGVTSVTVEVWGAGGGSGGSKNAGGGGGGGGGGYSRSVIAVTPGNSYTYQVGLGGMGGNGTGIPGSPGTQSFFINNTTVSANGGSGGDAGYTPALGGLGASLGVGTFKYEGGKGGNGGNLGGGGGGSSAGTSANGNFGSNNGGLGGIAPIGGGNGGNATTIGNGTPGFTPGGGGGGSQSANAWLGQNGANGKVVLTYTPILGGNTNEFSLKQIIKGDSLCIEVYYKNDNSVLDTLGSSNLRINFDTSSLDKSTATITYRGPYDALNNSGYQAMTLSAITGNFLSLNIFNNDLIGYGGGPIPYTKHVATVCIKIKNFCGTSGVDWRAAFPFSVANHYNGTSLVNQNYVGGFTAFSLCTTSDTLRTSTDSLCFGTLDTLAISMGTMGGYAFYSNIDGYIDTLNKTLNPTINYITTSSLSVGTHQIYLKGYSCTGSCVKFIDTVTVVVSSNPTPAIAGLTTVCFGDTVTYSAVSVSNFAWNGEGGIPVSPTNLTSIKVLWGGIASADTFITIIDTNAAGCVDSASLQVKINSNPKPNLGPDDTLCLDGATQYKLVSNVKTTEGVGRYEWYLNGNPQFIDNDSSMAIFLGPSNVVLRLDSAGNGCYQYDTINIVRLMQQPPMTIFGQVSGDDTICDGETTTFMYMGGFGAYNYKWYLNGALVKSGDEHFLNTIVNYGDTITVKLDSGYYGNRCPNYFEDTAKYVMNLVTPVVLGDSTVCVGTSFGYSINSLINKSSWNLSGGGTFVKITADSIYVSWTNSGTWSILVSDTNTNGCVGYDTLDVVVTPQDDATFNYTSSSFCQDATNPVATITGTAGGTFSSTAGLVFVSTATGEIDLTASTAGTYGIKYVTNGVCKDSLVVSFTISEIPAVNLGADVTVCEGDTIILTNTLSPAQIKFLASDGAASDNFGYSVSISGNKAIFGSYGDDDLGNASGSVYIYEWNGVSWLQTTKLLASDGVAGDNYGTSVSISNSTIVIGAPRDDDKGVDAGAVYVYVWNGLAWIETKLTASDGLGGEWFGQSVSVDGNVIVVGAYTDNDNGINSGSVYVYRWNGVTWIETKLLASDGVNDDTFGRSVDVSGNRIIVGSDGDDDFGSASGSAYIYSWNGISWIEAKLLSSDGAADDRFGNSVSIDGNMAVIGAVWNDDLGFNSGSAYIYQWNGVSWLETSKLLPSDGVASDIFGNSVSISGNKVIVGARLDDDLGNNSGSAYIYEWNGVSWIETVKLLPFDGAADDNFGHSVSLSGDKFIIGADLEDNINGIAAGSAYYIQSPSTNLWSNGATTDSITIILTQDTTIWLQVTNGNGCINTDTINITVNPSDFVQITQSSCDSFFVAGAWQKTSGLYYDTLTNAFGCDSIVETNLTISTILDKAITPITTSACDSGTALFTVQNVDANVQYWLRNDFDDSYISGPLFSAVAGGNIGLLTGMVYDSTNYNVLATKPSTSIMFDGVDDYVTNSATSTHTVTTTTDLTVDAWVYPTANNGDEIIVSKYCGGDVTQSNFFIAREGISQKLRITGDGSNILVSNTTLPMNVWTHISVVFKNGVNNTKIYINGKLDVSGTLTYNAINAANELEIGDFTCGVGYETWTGRIDEVRLWNYARTSTEILNQIQSCLVGNEAGLVLNFDFEEGSGGSTFDKTGTFTGLLFGNTWMDGIGVCASCEKEMTQKVVFDINKNPKPNLGLDDTVCVVGFAQQYVTSNIKTIEGVGRYEWYVNTFQQFVDNDSIQIFGGTNEVVVRLDSAGNLCYQFDTVKITVMYQQDEMMVMGISSGNDTICNGEWTTFMYVGGMGNYHYEWYLNGNLLQEGPNHFIDTNIFFGDQVTVILDSGFFNGRCPNYFEDTALYFMPTPINASLTSTDTSLCIGEQAQMNVTYSLNSNYQWFIDNALITGPVANDSVHLHSALGQYFVVVEDTNGCVDTTNTKTLIKSNMGFVSLKVFLEGPYAGASVMNDDLFANNDTIAGKILENQYEDNGGPAYGGAYGITMSPGLSIPSVSGINAVDVLQLMARSTPNGANLDTTFVWLMQDGSIRDFQTGDSAFGMFCDLPSANYHVVVKHRNHLTIMTNNAILLNNGTPVQYNLTLGANIYTPIPGYIGAKLLEPGIYGMTMGNRFPTQQIDANDVNTVLKESVLKTGFFNSDIDLDGVKNILDWDKTSQNNDELYFSTTPNP